jgi:hypothetical protein
MYIKKLAIYLLAGLIAAITVQRIIYRLFWEFGKGHYPPPLYGLILCAWIILCVLVYGALRQRQEKRRAADSQRAPGLWQSIIGGFMGLDLAMFGWQKLFRQQGFVPLGRLDAPFSSFSGEELTWAYFGHSYPFTCVIGILQVAGAILLLFRRTRLFGALFLFPVLLTIVLLDIFYGFEVGDLVHALILLMGLLYLILRQYRRLAAFFFSWDGGSSGYSFIRNGSLAAAVIGLPLLLVISFGSPDRNPQLTGKYRVQDLSVNRVPSVARSCGDSVLTRVYFDLNNDMVLEFNGLQRRWIGGYRLDRSTGALVASWRYPMWAKDTLFAKLSPGRAGEWWLGGVLGRDSVQARLVKE